MLLPSQPNRCLLSPVNIILLVLQRRGLPLFLMDIGGNDIFLKVTHSPPRLFSCSSPAQQRRCGRCPYCVLQLLFGFVPAACCKIASLFFSPATFMVFSGSSPLLFSQRILCGMIALASTAVHTACFHDDRYCGGKTFHLRFIS